MQILYTVYCVYLTVTVLFTEYELYVLFAYCTVFTVYFAINKKDMVCSSSTDTDSIVY